MKQFSEQFHKKALKSVKLQKAERDDLRDRLIAYMEYHPLPTEMKVTKKNNVKNPISTPLMIEPFTVLHIHFNKIFKSSLVVGALLLVTIPFVAEKAVPGDTLYAVKVHINEEIMSTLIFDSYQKVEWETERLNRRIAEARLLASEGKLTEEAEAEVAEAVKEHTANAQREIEVLREEDAEAATIAAIALDTTLEVQATSFKKKEDSSDSEGFSDDGQSISLIANAIDESRAKTEEPTSEAVVPSYNKLMAKVEQNTTRIVELIISLEQVVAPEDLADVTRRAEDINRAIAEAIETAKDDDVLAREQLINVLQSTQKLIIFITELEVSETVDIETIIPVVLTNEEKEEEMIRVTYELIEKQKQIISLLAEIKDEELIEKIELSQATIAEIVDSLATTTDKFDSFVNSSKEAQALADDSLRTLLDLNIQAVEENMASTTATSTAEEVKIDIASSSESVIEEGKENSETDEISEEAVSETEASEATSTEDVAATGENDDEQNNTEINNSTE